VIGVKKTISKRILDRHDINIIFINNKTMKVAFISYKLIIGLMIPWFYHHSNLKR